MTRARNDLSRIHADYEESFGPFSDVVEFRRDSSDEDVPDSLDILFFLPMEGDDDVNVLAPVDNSGSFVLRAGGPSAGSDTVNLTAEDTAFR